MYKNCFKRIIDVVISILAIILLSWLYLIIALLIKCTSKGPVLFKQDRIGKDGKVFKILKFRSMRVGAEKSGVYSDKKDPRVTKIGRFIRATSIDELPQIIHILAGQMSWIGPRPLLPKEMLVMTEAEQIERQSVLPGITGWEAVNEDKSDSRRRMAEFDLEYVRNWSLLFDLKIFFLTIAKLFKADRSDDAHRAPKMTDEQIIAEETK